jgi:hypothetical protein
VEGLGDEISVKRSMRGYSFLTLSGRLSVNVEYKARIEYKIYLENRKIEGRSRLRWKDAGKRRGVSSGLSILRDRKSEFEMMTIFVLSDSVVSKMD